MQIPKLHSKDNVLLHLHGIDSEMPFRWVGTLFPIGYH